MKHAILYFIKCMIIIMIAHHSGHQILAKDMQNINKFLHAVSYVTRAQVSNDNVGKTGRL